MLFIQQHNSGSTAVFLCKGADNNLYIVTYSEDDLLSKYKHFIWDFNVTIVVIC